MLEPPSNKTVQTLPNLEKIRHHVHCVEGCLAKPYTYSRITVIPLDHQFFVLEICIQIVPNLTMVRQMIFLNLQWYESDAHSVGTGL